MKLYVCWGTFPEPLPGGHPCRTAHEALVAAGHRPEVVRCYGSALLPDALNVTQGRREVKGLTGAMKVPVLVTDDGEVVAESAAIARWAHSHPVAGAAGVA